VHAGRTNLSVPETYSRRTSVGRTPWSAADAPSAGPRSTNDTPWLPSPTRPHGIFLDVVSDLLELSRGARTPRCSVESHSTPLRPGNAGVGMSADAARRSAEECVRHMTLRILRGRRVAVPSSRSGIGLPQKKLPGRDFSRATANTDVKLQPAVRQSPSRRGKRMLTKKITLPRFLPRGIHGGRRRSTRQARWPKRRPPPPRCS